LRRIRRRVALKLADRPSVPQRKDLDDDQIARQAKATGLAIDWVSRILAIVAVMVLPGLGGRWLDVRFGANVFALLGFVLGLVVGIVSLIAIVKVPKPPDQNS
jgi:hypothetical protein